MLDVARRRAADLGLAPTCGWATRRPWTCRTVRSTRCCAPSPCARSPTGGRLRRDGPGPAPRRAAAARRPCSFDGTSRAGPAGLADAVTVPLQGEHFRRRPYRWALERGFVVLRHDRFNLGIIERFALRGRPGTGGVARLAGVEDQQHDPAGPYEIGSDRWPGLAKLAEEAGELIQVLAKLVGASGRERYYDGTDLRERLVEECGDLTAAIAFFTETNAWAPRSTPGPPEARPVPPLARAGLIRALSCGDPFFVVPLRHDAPHVAHVAPRPAALLGPDTCDPADLADWHPGNPARGQCGTTALVVREVLGGDLIHGRVTAGASSPATTTGTDYPTARSST